MEPWETTNCFSGLEHKFQNNREHSWVVWVLSEALKDLCSFLCLQTSLILNCLLHTLPPSGLAFYTLWLNASFRMFFRLRDIVWIAQGLLCRSCPTLGWAKLKCPHWTAYLTLKVMRKKQGMLFPCVFNKSLQWSLFLCRDFSWDLFSLSRAHLLQKRCLAAFLRSTGCRGPDLRSDWLLLCEHVLEAEVAEQKTWHSLFCSSSSPSSTVFYCSCSKLSFVFFCFPGLVKQGKSVCSLANSLLCILSVGLLLFTHCKGRYVGNKHLDWHEIKTL